MTCSAASVSQSSVLSVCPYLPVKVLPEMAVGHYKTHLCQLGTFQIELFSTDEKFLGGGIGAANSSNLSN